MAENEGTPKKAASAKKTATTKTPKVVKEAKPKAAAKPRKAKEPEKVMASITPIDINREPASTQVAPTRVSAEQIAKLAHQYWLERGCQHGHDAEDWFRAEQALRSKAS